MHPRIGSDLVEMDPARDSQPGRVRMQKLAIG